MKILKMASLLKRFASRNHMHIVVFIFVLLLQNVVGKQVAMKIVDEPSMLGLNNNAYEEHPASELQMRVQPSNFSGPPHLRVLLGKCFEHIDDSYKYELCPFSNVTQHEQSLRWNPYSGILGVWQEWEIKNNTYIAMVMAEGDSCNKVYRSVKVIFKCGKKNKIMKVSEPDTCKYEMKFETPYVCHPHAMLVYPTLSKELRDRWDILFSQYTAELLTEKGYNIRLHKIFEEAGLVFPETKRAEISEQAIAQQLQNDHNGEYSSLDTCNEEYKKLKHEVESLRVLLSLHNHRPNSMKEDDSDEHFGQHLEDF